MAEMLQERPLSVCVDADASAFMSYHRGIIDTEKCSGECDHAVLLVGMGTENGVDYWRIKNSWAR